MVVCFWQPVQGVPHLLLHDSLDRLQPSAMLNWINEREWMDVYYRCNQSNHLEVSEI